MDNDTDLGPRVPLRGIRNMTAERAQRGYRLTRFVGALRHAAQREAFAADPEQCMRAAGLSTAEQDMIRRKDFTAMLDYGVPTVGIAKVARALGFNLLQMGAAGRNQTPAEFLAERRQRNEGKPWQF